MAREATTSAVDADSLRDRSWRMLIGGELLPSHSGRTFHAIDPATAQPVATVPDAVEGDVERAAASAQDGFRLWRRESVRTRAEVVREMARRLLEHEDELAYLDAVDGGIPLSVVRGDVAMAVELMDLFAGLAFELKGETVPASAGNLHYTLREPYGVVVRIVPFNHPLFFAAGRIAAPLIAGNSVILKPADQTPLSALRMGELFQDLLPPGVLNVLAGAGPDTGRLLVRHPAARRVGFTGSVPTGLEVQRTAAETCVKTVTLELGGKNPMIIWSDVDLDLAADSAVAGMNFTWMGQSCGSTSRLLVHEAVVDELVERISQRVQTLRIGMPLEPDTTMGPVISQRHLDRILGYIDQGRIAGATLVAGGRRIDELAPGYFVEPTIFTDVTSEMPIAREEIFGPVLCVQSFRDEQEAVELANAVDYGLTASVWTNDVHRALRITDALEAGYVWVNGAGPHYWGMPFGGVKDSGVGREDGLDEMLSYTQLKAVNVIVNRAEAGRL